MEPNTVDVVLDVLSRTATAHGLHEVDLGGPDADWPTWYANHMVDLLTREGYRLVRIDG